MDLYLIFLRKSSRHKWDINFWIADERRANIAALQVLSAAGRYFATQEWEAAISLYDIDPVSLSDFTTEMERLPANFDFGNNLVRLMKFQELAPEYGASWNGYRVGDKIIHAGLEYTINDIFRYTAEGEFIMSLVDKFMNYTPVPVSQLVLPD